MVTRRHDWSVSSFEDFLAGGVTPMMTPFAVVEVDLTRREREVLRHLACRATDREIARALSISPRTVMHHVSHILAKLGVGNRRDAGFLAAQFDLV